MSKAVSKKDILTTRRWALITGINHYQDSSIRDLSACVHDAQALYRLFNAPKNNGYEAKRLCLLTSDRQQMSASRLGILNNLMEIADKTAVSDMLLFYFAGHADIINGEAYLIPSDASGNRLLADTAVPLRRVKEIVRKAPANDKAIILDVEHAQAPDKRYERAFAKTVFDEADNISILAASNLTESVWASSTEAGKGLFSHYLLEGLGGAALAKSPNFITFNDVAAYVAGGIRDWEASASDMPPYLLDFRGNDELVLLTTGEEPAPPKEKVVWAAPLRENPINRVFPIAVREPDDFFNRTETLERIRHILQATAHMPIFIQGDRGIGKTSLFNRVKRLLDDASWKGRHFLHFTVSPNGIFSCADFAREIWDGLRFALEKSGRPSPENFNKPFSFETFGRFAAELAQLQTHIPQITFVLFIDEFGKIIRQCDGAEYKRIEGLINYIVEATEFPAVFFVSLLQNLPDTYGSPIPASPIRLRPFERPDFNTMTGTLLNGYGSIDKPALNWLYQYTGGHPFFTKLILAKLFDRFAFSEGNSGKITQQMLRIAGEEACRSARADEIMRDIYVTYLNENERYILLWLAYFRRPLTGDDLAALSPQNKTSCKQLVRRDILLMNEPESYQFRLCFMGDWLRAWPRFETEIARLEIATTIPSAQTANLVQEGICINLNTQRVYVNGQEVAATLTDLEYRGLLHLALQDGQVVTKDELANHLYPEPYYEGDDQRISTLIYRIRRALDDNRQIYLQTLRKRGYRLQHVTLARF